LSMLLINLSIRSSMFPPAYIKGAIAIVR
jgi:hypothetical protein